MKSAYSTYLSRQPSVFETETIPVSRTLGMIVVIPCYNEPDLLDCLQSLADADRPTCGVEILVVVNSGENAPPDVLMQNEKTKRAIRGFAQKNNSPHFRLLSIHVLGLPVKYAGAGLARKVGMDEAVRRFHAIGNELGVIVSMDADCRVDKNYFTELYRVFCNDRHWVAAVVNFQHPLPGPGTDDRRRSAMIQYELYLRYYKHALAYTGFPYAHYTIGSAFAVTAQAYCKAGGMGKYQGGEDFYFLQKIFPLGKTCPLNTTTVYPSSRLSDRVPFGTGPSLIKLVEGETPVKLAYAWESFRSLRAFLSWSATIYETARQQKLCEEEIMRSCTAAVAMLPFLQETRFVEAMHRLSANCATSQVFGRRFFDWFNGLRILQCLNAMQQTYPSRPVVQTTVCLLRELYGRDELSFDPYTLLCIMRGYY